MKIKTIEQMTRKEIEAVPYIGWDRKIVFDSLIILPQRRMHDSGYRCLDFVAVIDRKPVYRLSGSSDVLHIDGIGGWSIQKEMAEILDHVKKRNLTDRSPAWSIDCLPKSGLLRLFSYDKMLNGVAVSSFELFSTKREVSK